MSVLLCSVLEYWTHHEHRFPNIHSLARKVLAIPASNTEVERLFSCSKMAVVDNRTRLDADKLNKVVFLRKNLHSLKQLDEKKEIVENESQSMNVSLTTNMKVNNRHLRHRRNIESKIITSY